MSDDRVDSSQKGKLPQGASPETYERIVRVTGTVEPGLLDDAACYLQSAGKPRKEESLSPLARQKATGVLAVASSLARARKAHKQNP